MIFPIFPSLVQSSFHLLNHQQALKLAKQYPLVLPTREHLFGQQAIKFEPLELMRTNKSISSEQ
jgi:hypothetical protein